MLGGHAVVSPDQPRFEVGEHPVDVGQPFRDLHLVVALDLDVVVARLPEREVAVQAVRPDDRSWLARVLDEAEQVLRRGARDVAQPEPASAVGIAALDRGDHHGLAARPTAPRPGLSAADVGLVHLHDAREVAALGVDHAGPELVQHVERSREAQFQLPRELEGRYARRQGGGQVGAPEPRGERHLGPVQDGPGRDGRLMAVDALEQAPALDEVGPRVRAGRADEPVGPPAGHQVAPAGVVIGEQLDEFLQRLREARAALGRDGGHGLVPVRGATTDTTDTETVLVVLAAFAAGEVPNALDLVAAPLAEMIVCHGLAVPVGVAGARLSVFQGEQAVFGDLVGDRDRAATRPFDEPASLQTVQGASVARAGDIDLIGMAIEVIHVPRNPIHAGLAGRPILVGPGLDQSKKEQGALGNLLGGHGLPPVQIGAGDDAGAPTFAMVDTGCPSAGRGAATEARLDAGCGGLLAPFGRFTVKQLPDRSTTAVVGCRSHGSSPPARRASSRGPSGNLGTRPTRAGRRDASRGLGRGRIGDTPAGHSRHSGSAGFRAAGPRGNARKSSCSWCPPVSALTSYPESTAGGVLCQA
jgi:hypothetical protein